MTELKVIRRRKGISEIATEQTIFYKIDFQLNLRFAVSQLFSTST